MLKVCKNPVHSPKQSPATSHHVVHPPRQVILAEQLLSLAPHEQSSIAAADEAERLGADIVLRIKRDARKVAVSVFIEVNLLGELGARPRLRLAQIFPKPTERHYWKA